MKNHARFRCGYLPGYFPFFIRTEIQRFILFLLTAFFFFVTQFMVVFILSDGVSTLVILWHAKNWEISKQNLMNDFKEYKTGISVTFSWALFDFPIVAVDFSTFSFSDWSSKKFFWLIVEELARFTIFILHLITGFLRSVSDLNLMHLTFRES